MGHRCSDAYAYIYIGYLVYNIIKVVNFPADNTLANFQRKALNFKQNQYFSRKVHVVYNAFVCYIEFSSYIIIRHSKQKISDNIIPKAFRVILLKQVFLKIQKNYISLNYLLLCSKLNIPYMLVPLYHLLLFTNHRLTKLNF